MDYKNWSKFKACIAQARGIRDFTDEGTKVSFSGRKNANRYVIRLGGPEVAKPYEVVVTFWPEDEWEILDYPKGTIVLSASGFATNWNHYPATDQNPERLYIWVAAYDALSITVEDGALRIMRAPKSAQGKNVTFSRGEPLAIRMSYKDFLESEEWRVLKQLVKKRSNGMCEVCAVAGVSRPSEDVHHLRYPKNPGDEMLEDLLDVCRPHHKQLHGLGPDDGPTITFIKS